MLIGLTLAGYAVKMFIDKNSAVLSGSVLGLGVVDAALGELGPQDDRDCALEASLPPPPRALHSRPPARGAPHRVSSPSLRASPRRT